MEIQVNSELSLTRCGTATVEYQEFPENLHVDPLCSWFDRIISPVTRDDGPIQT